MRLQDIRNMIEKSTKNEWRHIGCYSGGGPSFRDSWGKSTSADGWKLHHDTHLHVLVYRDDVQLTISWGMGMRESDKYAPEWITNLPVVDEVQQFNADVFWNGSLVDRHPLVNVGRWHTYLPDPRRVGPDGSDKTTGWEVTRWSVAFARLLHMVEHRADDFEEMMQAARFDVVDDLPEW